jgi:molybdenum cofactor cytidylyltransferase
MKFGPIETAHGCGAILAHSLRLPGKTLKKGRVLSGEDVQIILAAGRESIVAAQLESSDVGEDPAAARLVEAIKGEGLRVSAPFTGRCNLFAESDGLLVIDAEQLERLNFVHEELTVATLAPMTAVTPRQMVATVKVIPFAAAEANLARCEAIAGSGEALIRVAPYRKKSVAYIQTTLAGTKASVLDKSTRVLTERLERLGSFIMSEQRCEHDAAPIATAVNVALADGADMVLIAGASAIVDRRDVVPAGIEAAGGVVDHFGMPVDPGNLLLLAHHGAVPVIGLPGCARSPKMSGFDFVLRRLAADLSVTPADIMRMGAFGLLKEHAERPSPRARQNAQASPMAPARQARIGAIVLAAGQSRRMGPQNKLLERVDDIPMVAHAVEAACKSGAEPVVVVTGHERERVVETLAGFDVQFVHNPDYSSGLSGSLSRGLAALTPDVEGAIVCLGDMPRVNVSHLDRLIAAFDPVEGRSICVPTSQGKRGNPVLFGERFFAEMKDVRGDVGARHLIGEYADEVCEVEMGDAAVLLDVDNPNALAAMREGSPAPGLNGPGADLPGQAPGES